MAKSASTATVPAASRYQRVKAILDAASQGSAATYEGCDRFWNLPLDKLLTLELYGIRMIAAGGAAGGFDGARAKRGGRAQ